jgi:hypothetical protein
MMRPTGEAVEAPIGNVRGRGRVISDAEARRLRDMLGAMLMDMGLSRVDASRVLSLGANPESLQKRVARIPYDVRKRFRDLWRDAHGGPPSRLGRV